MRNRSVTISGLVGKLFKVPGEISTEISDKILPPAVGISATSEEGQGREFYNKLLESARGRGGQCSEYFNEKTIDEKKDILGYAIRELILDASLKKTDAKNITGELKKLDLEDLNLRKIAQSELQQLPGDLVVNQEIIKALHLKDKRVTTLRQSEVEGENSFAERVTRVSTDTCENSL